MRVGRGNLNRGEKGVSQLFQVKVEFGASVFVCNWVCLGLTLTSCKALGVEQRLAIVVLVYTVLMPKTAHWPLLLNFEHPYFSNVSPSVFGYKHVFFWPVNLHLCSSHPLCELSEDVGRDDVSTLSLAEIKRANRFLTTASLLASSQRFWFSGAGLQFAERCQAHLSYWQVKRGHHAACAIC